MGNQTFEKEQVHNEQLRKIFWSKHEKYAKTDEIKKYRIIRFICWACIGFLSLTGALALGTGNRWLWGLAGFIGLIACAYGLYQVNDCFRRHGQNILSDILRDYIIREKAPEEVETPSEEQARWDVVTQIMRVTNKNYL